MVRRLLIVLSLSVAVSHGHLALCAEQMPTRTAEVTDDEIASLIRDLGDPEYEKRTTATRRLCVIGMRAKSLFRSAAGSTDVEVALRVKQLLEAFDRMWFAGTEVRLAFSKQTLAWDDPVDLRITLTNRSKYPSRIPFQIDSTKSDAADSDARQVGVMLDVADFIRVRSDAGKRMELRVDDITADPAVNQAVDERVEATPISILQAGERVTITAHDFNRGWARYALLDRGVYTVELAFEPQWQDAVLAARHVGRVASNIAALEVTTGAPAAVARDGSTASLTIHTEGQFLVAKLTNRTDQPMLVNKNFGGGAPFAVASWVYAADNSVHEVPVLPNARPGWYEFDESLLVNVQAGLSIELARIEVRDLLNTLQAKGADFTDDGWTIHFGYRSRLDHHWQRRDGRSFLDDEKAPAILRKPISRRILSARHTSNRIPALTPE